MGAGTIPVIGEGKSGGGCPYLRPCSWKEGILMPSIGNRLTAGVQPGPH